MLVFMTDVAPIMAWTIFDDSLSLSNFTSVLFKVDHDCLPEKHELKEARVRHWNSPPTCMRIRGQETGNYFGMA